jgi:hypothetical protein
MYVKTIKTDIIILIGNTQSVHWHWQYHSMRSKEFKITDNLTYHPWNVHTAPDM